ncbi:hypothetical protein KY347_01705 [Candidatus Woesearchaeota archaeon]|nr:hypothetical protein [Candidatus Woesearchaeota archaeon]
MLNDEIHVELIYLEDVLAFIKETEPRQIKKVYGLMSQGDVPVKRNLKLPFQLLKKAGSGVHKKIAYSGTTYSKAEKILKSFGDWSIKAEQDSNGAGTNPPESRIKRAGRSLYSLLTEHPTEGIEEIEEAEEHTQAESDQNNYTQHTIEKKVLLPYLESMRLVKEGLNKKKHGDARPKFEDAKKKIESSKGTLEKMLSDNIEANAILQINTAVVYMLNGNYEKAYETLTLKDHKSTNDPNEGILTLENYLDSSPNALLLRGFIKLRQGKLKESEKELLKAYDADPKRKDILNLTADLYHKLGKNTAEPTKDYTTIGEAITDNWENALGSYNDKNYGEAFRLAKEKVFEELKKIQNPDNAQKALIARSLHLMANVKVQEDKYLSAMALFIKSANEMPLPSAYENLSAIFRMKANQ